MPNARGLGRCLWMVSAGAAHAPCTSLCVAIVLLAILSVCILWGWRAEAGTFGLAWGALLRIGEATGATRSALVLPRTSCSLNSQHFVHLLQATKNAELVRRRGRWVSHKVMEAYLQEIAASTFYPGLAPAAKQKVLKAASCFPKLLQQACQWTQHGIPTGSRYLLSKSQSVATCTGD